MVEDPLGSLRALAAASSFPTRGTLRVPGMGAPVSVGRGPHGVPTIEAATSEDLWFAQGLVTAGERLFQIELTLRAATGRLSEVFGETTYEQDRFTRTVGLHRAGERLAASWSDADHRMHERFRAGVSAWAAAAPAPPVEYSILGLDGPSIADDPAVWASCFAYLAWGLSNNFEQELLRLRIGERLGAEEALRLVPPTAGGTGQGSNAWVVAGSRAAGGAPLLANDPHLLALHPSPWMQLHLRTADYEARGVAFVFSPGIVLGSTPHHAWGATNVTGDVQDLFLVSDGDVLDTREEAIVVRGESTPRVHHVQRTRHGPVLDRVPVGDTASAWEDVEPVVALRWTGSEHAIAPSLATDVAGARSFEEFRQAVLQVGCPGQNFLYADVDGHIGYQMTGIYPIRAHGDGTVPREDHGWHGWAPVQDLPWLLDPPEGVIVTANDATHAALTHHLITKDFHAPQRADRIAELLAARPTHNVGSFAAIARDTVSHAARGVLPASLARTATSAARRDALAMLADWDHDLAADSQAAAIYETWIRAIAARALAERLGASLYRAYTASLETWSCTVLPRLLADPAGGGLLDDELLGDALDDALATLGTPIPAWGDIHRLTLAHPLANVPGLESLFVAVDVGVGGDEQTVAQSGMDEVAGGRTAVIASWRAVWDLADPAASRSSLPAGMSGNPSSPHWNDQVEAYATGVMDTSAPTPHLSIEPV